jgi:hypothetical protein
VLLKTASIIVPTSAGRRQPDLTDGYVACLPA